MPDHQYKNHIRFYPPHHFIFYPLVMLLFAIGLYGYYKNVDIKWLWILVSVIAFFLGWLSFMLRQHYALMVQNRIVILEMRFRYYTLTQQKFDDIESRLSFSQIASLRFAPDDELLPLIERTLQENLSADVIKRSIKNWKADDMRV